MVSRSHLLQNGIDIAGSMVLAMCVKKPVNHRVGKGSQGSEDGGQKQVYFIWLD